MGVDTVTISLDLYHTLKGERDDYIDQLIERIEKRNCELEKIKGKLCIIKVTDYGPYRDFEREAVVIKNESEFYEKAKAFIEAKIDEPATENSNEGKKELGKHTCEELKDIINTAAGTFFGKLAGLEYID